MLIFHTADIHLNSNLKSNLDGEKAKLRRDEIKNNFYNLISLAEKQNVQFFIIAGDMFDTETGIVRLKNQFLDIVSEHPNIKFLYVNGNHDETSFLNEDIPPNLYVFKKDWTYYDFDNITFAGKFVPIAVKPDHFDGLNLNPNRTNIVVLHGDITLTNSEDIDYAINLNALKGKNIDYLALGHRHDFEQGRLDNRGTFAYPGTLDCRGFDEIGTKGYISIDDSMLPTFHAYSSRVYEEEYIDISSCESELDIINLIKQKIQNKNKDNLIKIVLTGEVDISLRRDLDYITNQVYSNHFFVKIEDKSKIKIDINALMSDISIKGEFLRLVNQNEDIDPEIKDDIMLMGIKALEGEKF